MPSPRLVMYGRSLVQDDRALRVVGRDFFEDHAANHHRLTSWDELIRMFNTGQL